MDTDAASSRVSPQLACRQLDWDIDTRTLFGHFAHLPWAVLLDSADASHQDARYDIICAAPIATLVTRGAQTELSHWQAGKPSHSERLSQEPFALLSGTLQRLFPEAKTSRFPFGGGALGSFSYDLGRRIEKLPATSRRDIELPEMNIGFYDWALIFDYQDKGWHLLHYRGEAALELELQRLEASLLSTRETLAFALTSPWQKQITQAEYAEKFARVQEYLHSGDCYQINLTQRFSADYQGDEWQAYCKLRQANAAPFSAFMRLPQQALLSISPERFIQLRGDQIQTKPIKGTLPRHADPVLDAAAAKRLQASPKDRAENLMIVDLLRNDIGKVASPGSVSVPALFEVESFPAVHHLVSTVCATLAPQYGATDLLRAAFPGGSITGAPKIRAMQIIEELEPARRSLYCGSIGYLSQDGQMDTSITIRTLVAEGGKLYCWAGGGIVADSQMEAEYQESFDKVSRILPLLE
ncbi:aminodeoxychorismate synthase component I [Shewanella salipaludis]|uniref:aminodeoxychorismate synthase n=1 Tax=Shewanella salipaludis TaxID=2723052 RepID=A0A972FVS9_9GAMM|nr:aminodeoxychorismate synthase component I [Shewanella salipaludis]NMH64168.1 aminodeoxychorismate synthase component I [Shewanella salipaludis]